jgi:hypothetical protein
VRAYVDGVKVLDLAGVDTSSSQRAGRIIQIGYSNSSATYLFDDLYAPTAQRARRAQDHRARPTADVAKAFTPRPAPTTSPCLDEPGPTPPM